MQTRDLVRAILQHRQQLSAEAHRSIVKADDSIADSSLSAVALHDRYWKTAETNFDEAQYFSYVCLSVFEIMLLLTECVAYEDGISAFMNFD
jgi:hypothetical protein